MGLWDDLYGQDTTDSNQPVKPATGTNNTFNPGYLRQPEARNAYGPYLTGDIANRTVAIDDKTRVDPYTGQRFGQGDDGTWREAGFLNRDQTAALRAEAPLPQTGQSLRDQTVQGPAMSANAGLRPNAATAGMVGGLQPQDAPHYQNLSDYRMPGLGFDAAQYTQMKMPDMSNIALPTPVTRAPYGFDYGGGAQHVPGSTKTTGPAAFAPPAQNFQVPNGYQPGPSGFSLPGGNFQAFAMPFGIQNPTFGALSQSAPAQIQPNLGGATNPNPSTTPNLINPTGGVGNQAYGPPVPAAGGQPAAAAGGATPVPNAPEQGGRASTLAPDRQAFINQAYPVAAEWSAKTGIPAELYLAINGSESNFGKSDSYFGVKGTGNAGSSNYATHEVVNGQNVPQNDQFAKYNDLNSAYQGFHDFLANNERYAPALQQYQQDRNATALLENINKAGYATDPNWAKSVQSMAEQIRPNMPNGAPEAKPGVAGGPTTISGLVNQGITPNEHLSTGAIGRPLQSQLTANSPVTNYGLGAGQQAPAAAAAGGAGGGPLYPPVGPGDLKPGGMDRPGGAGALWLNGSQTADVRAGGQGMGFNADTILKDYGRGGISQDAATRAQVALALMNENQTLQTPNGQLGSGAHSPLDAYLAMMTPSATNYGAPDGGGNPVGGAGAFGNAGNPGAYGPDGPDRGFAAGGSITANPGMQLPLDNGRATPAVVAPLDNSAGNMAQPRYTPQGQQQAQQATYLDSTAQAAAPSNSEGAIAPIANQGTTSQTPTAQNTALPQTMGGGDTSGGANYNLPTGAAANDPTDALAPFRDALTKLGVLSRQRAADASRYSAAGLSAPTAIDTLGGGGSGALPPGLFYDPTNQIQGRVSDIVNLQNTLAQLGNPGSVDQLTGQMVPLQQLQSLFGNMDTMKNQLAAYGQVGDPSQYLGQMNSIDQLLARYNEAQGIQTKLSGLGNVGDPTQMAGQLANYGQQLNQYQQAEDLETKLAALGQVGDTSGVQGQMSGLQQLLAKYQSAQDIQTKLSGLGNVQDPNALNQQIAALSQQLDPLKNVQSLQTELTSLGNPDVASLQARQDQLHSWLDPYMQNNANILDNGDTNPAVVSWYNELQSMPNQISMAQSAQNRQTEINNILQSQGITGDVAPQIGNLTTQMQGLQQQLGNAQSSQQLQSQYQNQLAALGLTGDINQGQGQTQSQYDTLKQQLAQMQSAQATQSQYQNQLSALGLGGQSMAQLQQMQGQTTAQRDALNQQYQNALQQQQLQSQYQNQLQGLVPQGQDINQAIGGLQAQRGGLAQQLSDAQKAQELQMNLGNLQGQTGGQTEAGVQSQLTQLTDALSRARQAGTAQSSLSNLLAQGVPGAGKLPGFAQGGRIQAGNFGPPSANDVQGYQRPPDSSGKNLAEMMRGMGGLGVTMGQWDPNWNIRQNPAHFANGGSMTTPEEIVGIGKYSGKPYFRVGEAGPERLTVQPLTGPNARPSKIPMGVMNRAAA